jgi:uncharacterized RDD family membrane protein YckC
MSTAGMSGRRVRAAHREGHYAGFLSRAVGLVIDFWVVAGILTVAASLVASVSRLGALDTATCRTVSSLASVNAIGCLSVALLMIFLFLFTTPLYYVLCWTLVSQTIGQRIVGVRVINIDGHDTGFRRSVVRVIGYALCFLSLGIGFLWVLIDNRRMGWHDKLAQTCVVYSWKAVQHEGFVARVRGPG